MGEAKRYEPDRFSGHFFWMRATPDAANDLPGAVFDALEGGERDKFGFGGISYPTREAALAALDAARARAGGAAGAAGVGGPNAPLPWKAACINGTWDVTNDAGDPREEYSATECMDERTARFIAAACNRAAGVPDAAADLVAACELAQKEIGERVYVAGCVDDAVSPELRRLWRIQDALRAALRKARGEAAP